jgi:hypothetical protein
MPRNLVKWCCGVKPGCSVYNSLDEFCEYGEDSSGSVNVRNFSTRSDKAVQCTKRNGVSRHVDVWCMP